MRRLIEELRRTGASLGGICSEAAVRALEQELRVPFPPDYRAFLLEAGGPGARNPWRGLWRVDEVASLNRHLPVFQWFGGLFGIGNEGISVYALDYRRGMPPPVVLLAMSSSDWGDVMEEAASFETWVRGSM
ncbi:MAG: SMI1/KNR4 family protein [Planctomycetes bacterium]|nr:SMI1/KNR4 family protein [Planctomycetota bacterium]